jgi:hypothetical protein
MKGSTTDAFDPWTKDWLHLKKRLPSAVVFDNCDANDASRHDIAATLSVGSVVVLRVDDLTTLITRLSEFGYEVKGPVVRSVIVVRSPGHSDTRSLGEFVPLTARLRPLNVLLESIEAERARPLRSDPFGELDDARVGGECDRRQFRSGTISMAPQGHSFTQMPHPLQKS